MGAAEFAAQWPDAHYQKGETQSFYNDYVEVLGAKRRLVTSFEQSGEAEIMSSPEAYQRGRSPRERESQAGRNRRAGRLGPIPA